MLQYYIYHGVKVLHIFGFILTVGFSFAQSFQLKYTQVNKSGMLAFDRFVWFGFAVAITA